MDAVTDFLADWYLVTKSLHVISVITWMAGLFYLPRLFVYHAEQVELGTRTDTMFQTMERRLLRGIMNPSMIATLVFVAWLLYLNPAWLKMGWLHAKLLLVVLLVGYHHVCGTQLKRFARGENARGHVFYRWFNEVPVLFLLGIVILVVVKPF